MGQVLLFISALSSCKKIRDLIRSITPGTFLRSLLASQFLVLSAHRCYHRYMTDHPKLRKGRCLFVPNKDNNAGKELSAATISRWICTAIVDSHALLRNSESIPGMVKAHNIHAVATSLQLFNKVELHAVMKAGRWSSEGTFRSFYPGTSV